MTSKLVAVFSIGVMVGVLLMSLVRLTVAGKCQEDAFFERVEQHGCKRPMVKTAQGLAPADFCVEENGLSYHR
jgi:hypothetical protein